MFKSIFDTIMGTISNMNPIKHFIKYALDKTLNEFLKKQLTLQDFKNGPLNLQNIQINMQKINKMHLVSSPYIMHSGIIGNLRIILPPLTQLSTQSIQISISGVQIVLKPNKKFSQNFKQKMLQLHEMKKFYVQQKQVEGQISQTGPVDFFKQLLKKIIMNIKVNISNIAIKLYMNTPSQDKSTPQFYLMLRVPLIYLDKKQQKQIKKSQTQQINFNIFVPQISVHLLNQDIQSAQYKNMKCQRGDFPFKYPSVNHPRTILLIGSSVVPQNMISKIKEWKKNKTLSSMNFTQIGFKLITDYKKKTKQTVLHLQVANIELMVTPVQIKILSRFVAQIMQFKKILDSIIQQLKLETNQSVGLIKKKSNSEFKSGNNDLFSSIMMSLNDLGSMTQKQQNRDSDLLRSMIRDDKIMRESVRQFNLQCQKKMKTMKQIDTQTVTMQFQAIQFKESIKVNIQFTNLAAYILKYCTNQQYLRIWQNQLSKTQQIINRKIASDYFMFFVKKVNINIKVKQKMTSVQVKSVKMYNIKVHDHKQVLNSSQSFYQMRDSVDFQAAMSLKRQDYIINEIYQFDISQNAHFCVQQIISISQSESEHKIEQQNIKKYSIIPQFNHSNEDPYILYKPAVSLSLDNKQKCFKINLQVITVTTNLQLVLDFLNIVYPLMAYKRLSDIINLKRNQIMQKQSAILSKINSPKNVNLKKNIFESMYQYRQDVQSIQDLMNQNKNTLVIQIVQIKMGFRKGQICTKDEKDNINSNFGDLLRKQKQKLYEQQSFNKACFCNVNEDGIYLELQGLKIQKKLSGIKLGCKLVDIGIMKIVKSQITNLTSILSIKPIKPDDCIRVLKQNTHCQNLIVYIPELNAKFSEDDIVNVAALAVDSIKIVGNLLSFKEYLERQMMILQQRSLAPQKKTKRNQGTTQIQIKVYLQKVFIQLDYCSTLIQQIYLNINQQNQQAVIFKISKLVCGVKRQKTLKLKLCSFANDQMLTKLYADEVPKNKNLYNQKLISDADVFFQISDKDKPVMIFKVQDRNAFFEKLNKQNSSFVFKLIKREMECNQQKMMKKQTSQLKSKFKWSTGSLSGSSNNAQKFKFKHVNTAIQEQGQKKILITQINKQIKINVCNLLELKKFTQKIAKFTNYLKNKIKQAEQKLKSQTMLFMQRKNSAEIQSQSIQILIKISSSILFDIRPTFIINNQQKIFSNTRSVLTLNLHNNLTILINNDKNQKQILGQVSLSYYFLSHDDRQIQLNPLLLKQDQHLSQLGFKTILQINKIDFRLIFNQSNKNFAVKIKSILGEASLQTLCLLQLHFEQFLNHHIKNEMGISIAEIYDGEDFCVLEYDAETDPDMEEVVIIQSKIKQYQELQIEDLTGAVQIYKQKLAQKNNEQQILRSRSINFQPCKSPQISIQQLSIQKICFRISPNANQFDFVRFQGNQSVVNKRIRVKQVQQIQYYVFGLSNFVLKADFENEQNQNEDKVKNNLNVISLLIKIQKLEIYLSKQKNFGYSSLKFLENLVSQSAFIIFSNQSQLSIVIEKNPKKILIKTYCLKLVVGGTTQILTTLKKIKPINQKIQKSGWRKIYDNKNKQKQIEDYQSIKQSKLIKKDAKVENPRIVIMIPQSTVKITFQYENLIKIVDQQNIYLKQFVLNEEINDTFRIKNKVKNWAKSLAKNNIGTLLSGTALNLLIKLFSQLVTLNVWWLSKILGIFFTGQQ